MEFELNSNDGTSITILRDEEYGTRIPSFGPGGEASVFPEEDDVEELEEDVYSEDLFDYPEELTERMGQVSEELLQLREALAVEKECLRRETAEMGAASVRGRQHKERCLKQMMEVEHMCNKEFMDLNSARAKMVQLNRDVSDWRLTNGSSTGFTPYPMEVMALPDDSSVIPIGPSSTIPGRFTVNQSLTNAGIKSVPNVTLPLPALPAAASFQQPQPWVQVLPSSQRLVKAGERSRWKSGDTQEQLSHVMQF